MAVRFVRLGTPRLDGEGVRIGTVRRPPRGVPKAQFASLDYYDVWLPNLAPSQELVRLALDLAAAGVSDAEWAVFVRGYRKEMAAPAAAHVIATLAALSHASAFSVGCYCADERRCHRSVLRELLGEAEAQVAR